jgi:hypothetical protein
MEGENMRMIYVLLAGRDYQYKKMTLFEDNPDTF